ncbi:SMN family protein Smn1 [Schizosaccharomyces japonicus yFS275]|uniref:SMN family protein Smn1 n=1 Tax=Schizosaccharomyces japonicus (strain yFS275 / FY16936) TaxID=402676 RepID=B6K5C4_SCHJY|nr:SMN family protein Smn1 [Schizosaccharomyces japonicus yFS275]EEB08728.1 SMN family protein Smn1 [Schizosaccharomyces japonicus yFS275]
MEPTNKEVWDDSDLRRSYELALEEYNKYHSLQAAGAGKKSPTEVTEDNTELADVSVTNSPEKAEEGEIEDGEVGDFSESRGTEKSQNAEKVTSSPTNLPGGNPEPGSVGALPTPPPPLPLQGLSYDEAYRNLLMSWYYAGYYAGYVQGIQTTNSSK